MKKRVFRERYGFKDLEIIPKKGKEIKEEEVFAKPVKKPTKKKEAK